MDDSEWRKPRKLLSKFPHLTISSRERWVCSNSLVAVPLKGQLDSILQRHSKAGMVFLSPDYAASMQRYMELASCSRAGEILTSRLETAALPNSNAERDQSPIFAHPLWGEDMGEWQDTTQQGLQKLQLLNWKVGIIHPSSEGSFLVLPILAKEIWCLYAVGSHIWGPGLSYRMEGIQTVLWYNTALNLKKKVVISEGQDETRTKLRLSIQGSVQNQVSFCEWTHTLTGMWRALCTLCKKE